MTEYELFQEEWREEQRHGKHESSHRSENSGQGNHDEPIQAVRRSRTIEAEEGRENVDLHRRIPRVSGPQRSDSEETNEGVEEASPDFVFLAQLGETEQYEKGLTFRAVAWIPMLLALAKMFAVEGGWSIWGPKFYGWLFLSSWFTTEIVFIYASRHTLSTDEREKSLSLSREWRKPWSLPKEKMKSINTALSFLDDCEPQDEFQLGPAACNVLQGFNSWPLAFTPAVAIFRVAWTAYTWTVALPYGQGMSVWTMFLTLPISFFISPIVGILAAYPGVMYIALIYCVTSGWVLYWMERGVLFFSGRLGVSQKRLSRWKQATKVDDSDGLVPGYLALFQATLTVLRYARVLNDFASYDCSTTTQAVWYDWTL
jgi:hypothetical protein